MTNPPDETLVSLSPANGNKVQIKWLTVARCWAENMSLVWLLPRRFSPATASNKSTGSIKSARPSWLDSTGRVLFLRQPFPCRINFSTGVTGVSLETTATSGGAKKGNGSDTLGPRRPKLLKATLGKPRGSLLWMDKILHHLRILERMIPL